MRYFTLTLLIIFFTCLSTEQKNLPKISYVFTAEVSEKFNIPDDIRYCGMPNLKTFTIKPAWFHTSNLYYPINIDTIKISCMSYVYTFEVLTVTPWDITLRYIPGSKKL